MDCDTLQVVDGSVLTFEAITRLCESPIPPSDITANSTFEFNDYLSAGLKIDNSNAVEVYFSRDNINYEKKKTSFQPDSESKPFEPRRKKVKTVDDPNVYLGEVIAGEVINIKDIVSEDNDLIIECEIFGVDVYESAKTDFKIITLKLTDYTDSMYAKIFTTDTDELTRLLGILKNGKWFKFKGYTKKDKYLLYYK